MTWREAVERAAGAILALAAVGLSSVILTFGAFIFVDGGLRIVIFLAGALVFYVGSFAIGIKVITDAVSDNVVQRLQSQSDSAGRATRQAAPSRSQTRATTSGQPRPSPRRPVSRVRAGESTNVRQDVVVGVKFTPNAATKISIEPLPPLRFSVSRNGRVKLGIDCDEGVSWTVSRIGGNIRLAIEDGSGVGSGIAEICCDPDDAYTLTVPRIAMVRIEFDNGDKIGRTVDCAVAP